MRRYVLEGLDATRLVETLRDVTILVRDDSVCCGWGRILSGCTAEV